jgi:hypothetical protein
VKKDEKTARRLVRERSGDVCEVCGASRATNFQHRVNRSQGGQWSASNGLHVCGSGTTGCHGRIHHSPEEAYALGWSVKGAFDPAETPVRTCYGWVLLDDEGGRTVVAS